MSFFTSVRIAFQRAFAAAIAARHSLVLRERDSAYASRPHHAMRARPPLQGLLVWTLHA